LVSALGITFMTTLTPTTNPKRKVVVFCRLTTTDYLLMLSLHLKGSLSITDACSLLFLPIPSLHTLSVRLARAGHITIDNASDVPRFTLTDRGRYAIARYLSSMPTAN
jgi:hypothetical protein